MARLRRIAEGKVHTIVAAARLAPGKGARDDSSRDDQQVGIFCGLGIGDLRALPALHLDLRSFEVTTVSR